MGVEFEDARKAARLARIKISDQEVPKLASELSAIMDLMDRLSEVDVEGVEPMTSVTPMKLIKRTDKVDSKAKREQVLSNAPDARGGFFAVPKVVE